jgi:hypothetical protein
MLVEHLKAVEKGNGFAKDVLLMWNIQTARFTEAREIISAGTHLDEKRRIIQQGLEKAKLSI